MTDKPPSAQQERAELRQRLLRNKRSSSRPPEPGRSSPTRTAPTNPHSPPSPTPLFLADWSEGNPLYGRIIGWSARPGEMPEPVVIFDDDGHTWPPICVNMLTALQQGPVCIRDSLGEARATVEAHRAKVEAR